MEKPIESCCYGGFIDFDMWTTWTSSFKWCSSSGSNAHKESCSSQSSGKNKYI